MRRSMILATLALGLASCGRPTDVAVQFHEALALRDGAKAFALLSSATRARLAAIAKQAHDASGGTVSDDPAQMIVDGDTGLYPASTPDQPKVVTATLISATDARAKVEVKIGQTTQPMELVREKGHWRVDLPP